MLKQKEQYICRDMIFDFMIFEFIFRYPLVYLVIVCNTYLSLSTTTTKNCLHASRNMVALSYHRNDVKRPGKCFLIQYFLLVASI